MLSQYHPPIRLLDDININLLRPFLHLPGCMQPRIPFWHLRLLQDLLLISCSNLIRLLILLQDLHALFYQLLCEYLADYAQDVFAVLFCPKSRMHPVQAFIDHAACTGVHH